MREQEQLMDNLLTIDLEINDSVRAWLVENYFYSYFYLFLCQIIIKKIFRKHADDFCSFYFIFFYFVLNFF